MSKKGVRTQKKVVWQIYWTSDLQSVDNDSQCHKNLANHFAKVICNYPKSDTFLAVQYRLFPALPRPTDDELTEDDFSLPNNHTQNCNTNAHNSHHLFNSNSLHVPTKIALHMSVKDKTIKQIHQIKQQK